MTGTVDLSTRGGRLRAMLAVTPGALEEAAHALDCTTSQVHARLAGDDPDVDASDIVALSDVLRVPIPWILGEVPNPLQVLVRLRAKALTPTQELVMEVLAARYRLGEQWWTFEPELRQTIRTLDDGGLVDIIDGHTAGRVEARLTAAGLVQYVRPGFTSPVDRLRERVEHERLVNEGLHQALREEKQTSRALRVLLEQYESGARPPRTSDDGDDTPEDRS
ncbi:hypothetical protein [Cellulosimicrobium sp. Marseille-Q4280]|uniref:hypothetical protein n=1 Tax=Cellulosimicrobium sp. Marseille-Q4280 TaxID=2937992 RepID=UPI002040D2D0|nr:hypothetical protein [Cellulosimicrobium sp. Marseille-Q4280]